MAVCPAEDAGVLSQALYTCHELEAGGFTEQAPEWRLEDTRLEWRQKGTGSSWGPQPPGFLSAAPPDGASKAHWNLSRGKGAGAGQEKNGVHAASVTFFYVF